MKTLQDDDRATSQALGVLALCVVMVGATTFAAAGLQTQFESETQSDSGIEETQIEAVQSDQVSITPMVGDDIGLENAEVRISFPDRDAPDAVVTNLEAGMEQSETQTVTYEEEVSAGYSADPVTEEVTYYERTGTKTHAELDVYEYQREYEVEVHAYEWEIIDNGWWGNDEVVDTVVQHERPDASNHGGDRVEKVGKAKVWEYEVDTSGWRWLAPDYETRTATQANPPDADGDIEAVDWATETETRTKTVEHVESPGPEWEKVSDEPVGTETYELDEPQPQYEERTEEVVVGYDVEQETRTVERTATAYVAPQANQNNGNGNGNNGATVASVAGSVVGTISPVQPASAFGGSIWSGIGGQSSTSDYLNDLVGDDNEADESSSSHDYDYSSGSSSSSSSVDDYNSHYESSWDNVDDDDEDSSPTYGPPVDVGDDEEVDTLDNHYYEGDNDEEENEDNENYADLSTPGDNSPSPAQAALDNAADAAPFIDGSSNSASADAESANAAVGVGGTAGESQEGMWTQGESIIVQLDEPRIDEGDRVRVQIIDTEDNSVVLDKSIRAEGVEQISFDYDPGDTEAAVGNSPADGGGVTVDDISVDAPETSLGDLPGASSQNPDNGLGSSPPDNGGDSDSPSSGWDGSDGSSSTPSTGDSTTDDSTPAVDTPTGSDTTDSTTPSSVTGTGHTNGLTVDTTGIGDIDCSDCGTGSGPELGGTSSTYTGEHGSGTEGERYHISSPTMAAKPVATTVGIGVDAAAGLVTDHDPATNFGRIAQIGGDVAASAAEDNSIVADIGESIGIRDNVDQSIDDNRDYEGDSLMEGAWDTVTGDNDVSTDDVSAQIEDPDTSTTQDELSGDLDTTYGASESTTDPNSGVGYTSGSSGSDDDDSSSWGGSSGSDDDDSSSWGGSSGSDDDDSSSSIDYGGSSSTTDPDSGVGYTTDSSSSSDNDSSNDSGGSTVSRNNNAGYAAF
jgi:hypothetical protein